MPDSKAMWADVRQTKAQQEALFKPSTRRYRLVEYISFMDQLARMIGCKPPNFRQYIDSYSCYSSFVLFNWKEICRLSVDVYVYCLIV